MKIGEEDGEESEEIETVAKWLFWKIPTTKPQEPININPIYNTKQAPCGSLGHLGVKSTTFRSNKPHYQHTYTLTACLIASFAGRTKTARLHLQT